MVLQPPLPGDVGFKQWRKGEAMCPRPEGPALQTPPQWQKALMDALWKATAQPTEAPCGRGRLLPPSWGEAGVEPG